MLAPLIASRLARRGIHYGWVMAALTFVVMLSTSAALGLPGVMLLPIQGEFGWSLATISGALALRLLLFGFMGPFAAAFLNRYGVRVTVGLAAGLIIGGLLLATRMTEAWMLWVTWGVMVGVGSGLSTVVLGAAVSSRWFVRHRGLVLGLLTASSATGQLAVLPLAAWLTEHAGWRLSVVPAVIACAIAATLMLLLGRTSPAEIGLSALGEAEAPAAAASSPQNPIAAAFAALRVGVRAPVFWVLFGTFFVCGLSTNGLIQQHFIPLCHDFGMSGVEAASVLAMMGVFDIVGTVASGWLSDRYDNRWLLFWYYGLRGLSLMALPFSTFSLYGLSLFAVFYGLDWIATIPPTVKLAAKAFGRERAPVIFGWVFTGHQIGAAVAALMAGVSREALASYLPAFYAAGLACLIAAVAVLFARTGQASRPVALAAAD